MAHDNLNTPNNTGQYKRLTIVASPNIGNLPGKMTANELINRIEEEFAVYTFELASIFTFKTKRLQTADRITKMFNDLCLHELSTGDLRRIYTSEFWKQSSSITDFPDFHQASTRLRQAHHRYNFTELQKMVADNGKADNGKADNGKRKILESNEKALNFINTSLFPREETVAVNHIREQFENNIIEYITAYYKEVQQYLTSVQGSEGSQTLDLSITEDWLEITNHRKMLEKIKQTITYLILVDNARKDRLTMHRFKLLKQLEHLEEMLLLSIKL
jgi:hypothetical protein